MLFNFAAKSPSTDKIKAFWGFTLAEVLITLGIIGVVAALTMPSLIQHHKKQEVETKLKRFYSTINQAIIQAEADKGSRANWNYTCGDHNGTQYSEQCLTDFYNNYLKGYLNVVKTEYNPTAVNDEKGGLFLYFADGSIVRLVYGGRDYLYFINNKNIENCNVGKDCFPFSFYTTYAAGLREKYFLGKGVEPTIVYDWDGTEEGLKQHPYNYGKIIQLNGWKIPKDYPLKF